MNVDHVSTREFAEFAHRYHYSGHSANQSYRYGLWYEATLWGVCGFNLPTRETCASVFGLEHVDRVAHLSRLAMADHAPKNSESRLIAGALTMLASEHERFRAVITYADPLEGHIGYVYQATNAIYTGLSTVKDRYVTPEGLVRGTYDGAFISRASAMNRGWSVVQGVGKHRYVYLIGTPSERRAWRKRLLLEELPYPKKRAA